MSESTPLLANDGNGLAILIPRSHENTADAPMDDENLCWNAKGACGPVKKTIDSASPQPSYGTDLPSNSSSSSESTVSAGDDDADDDGYDSDVDGSTPGRARCIRLCRAGFAVLALLVSIPAMVGAWCLPALLAGLVGGTVSFAARQADHYISFFVTLIALTLVCWYMFHSAKKHRHGSWMTVYGPSCIILVASVFIMCERTRHVLLDLGLWEDGGMYRDDCDDESISCLSAVGFLFTIVFTYIGFSLLILGSMWNTNIISKFKKKFADIKRQFHATPKRSRNPNASPNNADNLNNQNSNPNNSTQTPSQV